MRAVHPTPTLPEAKGSNRAPEGPHCRPSGPFAAILIFCLVALTVLSAGGCADRAEGAPAAKPRVVASIPPIAAIVREVAGDRAEVACILRPGVSEHLFEARPSDMRAAEGALALVACSPDVDPWSERIPAARRIHLFRYVPVDRRLPAVCAHGQPADRHGHAPGDEDGHFWSDPSLVRDVLPRLVQDLARLDPPGAAVYRANAARFDRDLERLDAETSALLAPVRGRPVFTYHAGLQYMLHRYGLEFGGVVEAIPGQEPTAPQVAALVARMRQAGASAIFTEPHLSPRGAQVLSAATGVAIFELDPIGGVPGRATYRELIEYNAATLARALAGPPGSERAAVP